MLLKRPKIAGGGKRVSEIFLLGTTALTSPAPSIVLNSAFPPSPPLSPDAYNFVLSEHSPLGASIAATTTYRAAPQLNIAPRRPLFTRSAEPSPIQTTFGNLDQSRPPPEFIPRMTAKEFSVQPAQARVAQSQVKGKEAFSVSTKMPLSRHTTRLPSLAQIQAKMSKTHRRGASAGSVPLPRPKSAIRLDSDDSIEILQTPTDEFAPRDPRIFLPGTDRASPTPTPPSPSAKEGRLAPFLRQRTNGRLAGVRPVSMPPTTTRIIEAKPILRVTPPAHIAIAIPRRSATPPIMSPTKSLIYTYAPAPSTPSPTKSSFNLAVCTPPSRSSSTSPLNTSYPSPTGSIRSQSSAPSPTLSVPIITCTPVRDESDGEDVVVFDGENGSEVEEREEREKRGKEMRDRLRLRRRSD